MPTAAETTPARRWAGWPPAGWLLLVAGAVGGLVAVGFLTFVIWFGDSTTCGDPASAAQVRHGQRDLLLLIGVALAPWAAAVLRVRRRGRVVVAALVCVSPALAALVVGLRPETWRGSFCF